MRSYPFTRRCGALAVLTLLGLVSRPAAAADPASGTLSPSQTQISYTAGPFLIPNPAADNASACGGANPCDDYALTVDVPSAYASAHPKAKIRIDLVWNPQQTDLDLTVLDSQGKVAGSSGNGPGTPETVSLPVVPGTQTYHVRIYPFLPGGATSTTTLTLDPGAADPAPGPVTEPPATAPRYQVYVPPAPLGENAGEPSLGYNLKSRRVMYIAGLQTLRATFAENQSPAQPAACEANWEDVSYVVTATKSLDPILFTDQRTGRTFVSQLNSVVPPASPVLVGLNSLFAYTDDDGASWTPGQLNAPDGSYDHQTVGAGPYPSALSPVLTNPLNGGSAIYYCSQAGLTAFCSRSDDGGLNFGRSTAIYNALTDGCGGIHGHVRVGADGTVYVPNRGCSGHQAVTVSTDAGTTWNVRPIPSSTPPAVILDPSVAPASDGKTLYFCYVNADGLPHVAVSTDHGQTWPIDRDIGAPAGIKNAVFAEAVAGDSDRAACGFVGTTTAGNHEALDFPGVWYVYLANTYDGGNTWTTVNATPGDPVQQAGGIWNEGGSSPNRNLLDFNEITLDERGRVIYSFSDGCIGSCVPNGPNSYSAKAGIVRQSGGKPLFAKFDGDFPQPTAPQQACLAGRRDDLGAFLSWRKPDTGGATISGYRVFRSTDASRYTQVGMTGGKTAFNDRSADPSVASYFYRVTALNARGESLPSNTIQLPLGPRPVDANACVVPGVLTISDPAGDPSIPNAAFDITSVSLAEPVGALDGKLVFTLKVASLANVPPGFRWAVRFTPPTVPSGQEDYFVSMVTSDGAAPTFTYGNTGTTVAGQDAGTRVFTTLGSLDAASNFAADGTITLVLDKAKIGGPLAGDVLVNILGSVRATAPSAVPGTGGTNETIPDSTSGGSYKLRAADFCRPNTPPVALLTASVVQGAPPLAVGFSGVGSSDAEDAIAKYTFNFGDGTGDFEQATPTLAHTYASPGIYPAQLIVTDARGLASANVSRQVIQVGTGGTTTGSTTGGTTGSSTGGTTGTTTGSTTGSTTGGTTTGGTTTGGTTTGGTTTGGTTTGGTTGGTTTGTTSGGLLGTGGNGGGALPPAVLLPLLGALAWRRRRALKTR